MNEAGKSLKYDQVMQHIIRGIQRGIYPDQSKIPSEKDIACELGVSVISVREGLKRLCGKNIIIKQQGRRSIVNASSLKEERRSRHIGWIGRDHIFGMNPVYFETYSNVLRLLMETDCHLTFLPFQTGSDEKNILRIFDSFDGFFLTGIRSRYLGTELENRLKSLPNVIEIDDIGSSPAHWTVCSDNYRGGLLVGQYVVSEKRRCPVIFLSDYADMYPAFNLRNRGMIDALSASRMPFVIAPGGDKECGTPAFADRIAELLKKYPEIDTIWHPQDSVAVSIRKVFESVAPRGEGYYRSCGVDGLPEMRKENRYHASAAHSYDEVARLCTETMLNCFSGQYPAEQFRRVPPVLIPWE